jgi:hypothetical protein
MLQTPTDLLSLGLDTMPHPAIWSLHAAGDFPSVGTLLGFTADVGIQHRKNVMTAALGSSAKDVDTLVGLQEVDHLSFCPSVCPSVWPSVCSFSLMPACLLPTCRLQAPFLTSWTHSFLFPVLNCSHGILSVDSAWICPL